MAQVGKQFSAIEIDDCKVAQVLKDDPTTRHTSAPAAAPTLAAVAGGSLAAATYYVAFTWVDGDGQTNTSPEASVAAALNYKITVTLPTFPSTARKARIYAGTASGTLKYQGETATTSFEITAFDSAGVAPPALSYDTSVDVPEIVEVAPEPQFKEAVREGDAEVTDVFSKVTHVNFSLTCRTVPLDVLALWAGGSVVQTPESSGGAKDSKTDWTVVHGDLSKFFRLQGRWLNAAGIDAADGQRAILTLHKCRINRLSYRLNGQWAEVQASGMAVRSRNNRKIQSVALHENDQALS